MTTNKPIKCVSRDFRASPFYLIQTQGSERRFIASFQDGQKIKTFLAFFIDQALEALQIQIRDLTDREHPVDYEGEATKTKLKAALNNYEEVVFQDGFHELMLRHPETGDYIVFDEHGLVFIYSQNNYGHTLNNLGLTDKANERLIDQFDHWHYRPANGRHELSNLIRYLELK